MSLSDAPACIARADRHLSAGLEIMNSNGLDSREWAAVCFFYSAYHRVRAALLIDPVFRDASRLASINANLQMADRTAAHHQGRAGGGLGVRDVVPLLYPLIHGPYVALHQASIDVRYGSELVAPLDDLLAKAQFISQKSDEGALVAVAH